MTDYNSGWLSPQGSSQSGGDRRSRLAEALGGRVQDFLSQLRQRYGGQGGGGMQSPFMGKGRPANPQAPGAAPPTQTYPPQHAAQTDLDEFGARRV